MAPLWPDDTSIYREINCYDFNLFIVYVKSHECVKGRIEPIFLTDI